MARRLAVLSLSILLAGCGGAKRPADQAEHRSADSAPKVAAAEFPPVDAARQVDEIIVAANELAAKKDWQGATRQLARAISLQPGRSELYVKRATLAAEGRMFSTAILDMNAAVKLEPRNPRLYNTRGYFHLLAEQLDNAEQDFNDAIGMDLAYPQPHNNRGLVAIARKDFARAVKEFDNSLRIDPRYADALNNRGFAQIHLKDYEQAVVSLTAALEVNPQFLNALTNRARAYMLWAKYAEAAADFTRAIELQPQQLAYYASRAEAWQAAGQTDLARADAEHVNWTSTLQDLNQQIARNPRSADPWVSRGNLFLQKHDLAAARESFRNALVAQPLNREALLGQTRLDMADGQHQKVVDACTALLAGGELFEARSLRGDALLELGKLDEAIADYQATRRLDGQVISAYLKRAQRLRAAGNSSQAQQDEQLAASLQQRLSADAGTGVIQVSAPEFPTAAQ